MSAADHLPRIRKHEDSGRLGGYETGRRDQDSDRRDRDAYRGGARRRSRSPHRRRREPEHDTYSSSRDYRAREREERYTSGRDAQRGERGYDRERARDDDRGSVRRDARRDDGPRRDRDLFEGRGGMRDRPPRGDRGERDEMAQQMRKRSNSPAARPREATPDLTGVVSILERKRRLTQWDIKPPGYEMITAEQAKLSGMFPLPGAPRAQEMDPSKLQAFMTQSAGSAGLATLKASSARQAKRLFVSGMPSSATEESLASFFNLQLNGLNVIASTDPCASVQMIAGQEVALIEFKNSIEATVALALDGIHMEASNGVANGVTGGLSLRRPKDYIVPAEGAEDDYQGEGVSYLVPDTPQKISITNLLSHLTDEQVTELLVAFGPLKAFILVKDVSTGESRGIAFCEYVDPASTDMAVEGLNNMELGEQSLRVQRASVGVPQTAGTDMGVTSMSTLAASVSDDLMEGRVLQLLNIIMPEELVDDQDYDDICEDVKEECVKYGPVLDVKIPRPPAGGKPGNGVGRIYIKYESPQIAREALRKLAGRKFADRTVITSYFSEESFDIEAW